MILCIGDSITLGIMGYSYIPFADKRKQLVNLGLNGESLRGGARRLCRYMRKQAYREADTVIFSLGTNDILLPYLGNRSRFWHMQYRLRNIIRRFSSDIGEFAGYYEEAVRQMKRNGYKVVLVGLPYIQLAGYPLGKVEAYNSCIRSMARTYETEFIDIYEMQRKHVRQDKTCSWGKLNAGRIADGLYMLLFPGRKDVLSRKRSLDVTVDGVHFNSRSARLLAEAVGRALKRTEAETAKR
ncbi:SGNH/GDSL hydrolase family protein [Dorea sp. D27]|uniref:SGNH/GDSL hydrolase family protein n=1 Tax=Dorea sp. D27 TaxID=658665 RepID=UPI0006732EF6|nr:SGNH/GDSL hydrolase family protein [Dorea sp. D27]KMZ54831.1 lipase/acylhydrolase, GDSL family [Dorea sp. D27]